MRRARYSFVISVLTLVSGCATAPPISRQYCGNPDAQLANLLRPLEALRATGCTAECDRLALEIERLAVICPGHAPTLLANAVIAYDNQRPAQAQLWLDQILSPERSHPEAAVLRARIAIEEGNLAFAQRLLERQINLAPDHAALHETLGGALYLERQLDDARRELQTAAALGAPRWRVAYHLGLVEEAAEHLDDARRHYAEALDGNPDWSPARSRLNALRAATTASPSTPR